MYGEYCQNFQHVIFNILCKHSEAHFAQSNKSYTDYNNAQYKFMAE